MQIEEEPAATTSTVTGTGMDMPHLRIKTQPVTQESARELIALQKNMPDEVLSVLAKVGRWPCRGCVSWEVTHWSCPTSVDGLLIPVSRPANRLPDRLIAIPPAG
jgi:hypothetical protein